MMTLDVHPQKPLSRAQTRQGAPNKAARTGWGQETTVLKIERQAAIGSLLRYALVSAGSPIPENLLRKIEAKIVDVAARKVMGLL